MPNEPIPFTVTHPPSTDVKTGDVLIVKVPALLSSEKKENMLAWFRGAIAGTSLDGCRVILLDGGVDIEIYRGERSA